MRHTRSVVPECLLGSEERTVKLSTVDQVCPRIYQQRVLCFRRQPDASPLDIFDRLCASVALALQELPHLAGLLVLEDEVQQTLAIQLDSSSGLEVTLVNYEDPDADIQWRYGTFDELQAKNFPIGSIPMECLAPKLVAVPTREKSTPCCYLQANFIPGEGLLLAYGMHHSVSDLLAFKLFLKALAQGFAALTEKQPTVSCLQLPTQAFDRLRLEGNPSSIPADEFPDVLLDRGAARTVQASFADARDERRAIKTAIWKMTAPQLHALKRSLLDGSAQFELKVDVGTAATASAEERLPSTAKTLFAFLWLSICTARQLSSSNYKSSQLLLACNIRPRLDPPLDPCYIGNAAFIVRTSIEIDTEALTLSPANMARAFQDISQCLSTFNFAKVKRQIDFLASAKNYADVRYEQNSYFGPDLLVTDQSFLDAYSLDWGPSLRGQVVSLRLHADAKEGVCYLFSSMPDGAIEFCTVLDEKVTQRLASDETFAQYATLQTSTAQAV